MIVLHCLAPAPFGGLESVVYALTTGHQARGHKIVVAAVVEGENHPFVYTLKDQGIEVIEVQVASRNFRKERKIIAEIIQKYRPNIVHAHGYRSDILDLPVAKRFGISTVTTLHGFTGGDWKLRLYERLQLRSLRHIDAVVAVAQGIYNRALRSGVSPERLHLIPNAYAPSPFLKSRTEARAMLQIPEDQFTIAWIGRFSHEKGGDILLDAMATLQSSPIKLSMIGDGPHRQMLTDRATALGVSGNITMHGIVQNAGHALPAFDAFVLSSRTEGTPMVVLEAMAAGVPIIATRVGGIPQMLSEDEALLVEPENPTALANAIRAVYDDPTGAQARVLRAQERLQRDFGVAPWLERYESLYTSLLK
jgi:glycosyltransferase involved in cell wall biosynthesis